MSTSGYWKELIEIDRTNIHIPDTISSLSPFVRKFFSSSKLDMDSISEGEFDMFRNAPITEVRGHFNLHQIQLYRLLLGRGPRGNKRGYRPMGSECLGVIRLGSDNAQGLMAPNVAGTHQLPAAHWGRNIGNSG